jgi:cytoskeletal protein CcmA (bactofilin family)
MPESTRTATAHIGKSVVIKGQLSGSEDLYLDGEVEGTIDLPGNTLTIGPSAKVRANISAKTVIIQGNVNGNVRASDKVELKNSAQLSGDISTKRIAIDDGAFFKGGVDIQRSEPQAQTKAPATTTAAPTASTTSAPTASTTSAPTAPSAGAPSTAAPSAPKPSQPASQQQPTKVGARVDERA